LSISRSCNMNYLSAKVETRVTCQLTTTRSNCGLTMNHLSAKVETRGTCQLTTTRSNYGLTMPLLSRNRTLVYAALEIWA
jgi:hypothetical protein